MNGTARRNVASASSKSLVGEATAPLCSNVMRAVRQQRWYPSLQTRHSIAAELYIPVKPRVFCLPPPAPRS